MKRFLLAVLVAALPSLASAQSVSDLVQVYLAQNGKTAAPSDYATCQPEGQADGICTWNTAKLGAQPTTTQLQSYTTTWQNMQAALTCPPKVAAGVTITSTGTPALNGTYSVEEKAVANITATATSIANGLGLPGGQSTFQYADQSGVFHTFNATQYLNFSTAMRDYSYNLQVACINAAKGQSVSFPSSSATIP